MSSNIISEIKNRLTGSRKKTKEEDQIEREHVSKETTPPEPAPPQHELKFSKMTIGAALIRGREDEIQPAFIALSRALKPGLVELAEQAIAYSYELFREEIGIQLNQIYPAHPVEAQHAFFSYIESDGLSLPTINNQSSFEVALNHIYFKYSDSEVATLIFQPEREENRVIRIRLEEELASVNRQLEEELEAQEYGDQVREMDRQRTAEIDEAGRYQKDDDARIDAIGSSISDADREIVSQAGSPPTPQTDGGSSTLGSTIADRQRLESPSPQPVQGPSSNTSRSGTPVSHLGRGARGVAQRPARETSDDRSLRFRSLWEEKERISFQKGGDGVAEEDVVSKTQKLELADEDTGIVTEIEGEEEEEEDDNLAQEDRAVGKLRALLEMPELAQLEDPEHTEDKDYRWKECCKMFGIDPDKNGIDERVTIAGLKTKIYQYQAFGIYWQMITSRKYGGGFVADDMGLGKTLSFLSYIVVERQLVVLWERVEKARQLRQKTHLQDNDKEQTTTAICPSPQVAGWILCPCSNRNSTSQMKPKLGLRMACVPTGLVRPWWDEFKRHIDLDQHKDLGLNIIVDHKGAFDNRSTQADRNSLSDHPQQILRAGAEMRRIAGKTSIHPKPHQAGTLLVTTRENYPVWEKKFAYGVSADVKKYKLVFGIVMTDESHEDGGRKGAGRSKTVHDLPSINEPFIWGYSGTPLSETPWNLEGILHAIKKHTETSKEHTEVSKELVHAHAELTCSKLQRIGMDFKTQKDAGADDDRLDEAMEELRPILRRLMLRRVQKSTFFGHPLIKLKPHIHQDVKLQQKNPVCTPEDVANSEKESQTQKEEVLAKSQERFDNDPSSRRSNVRPTKLGFNTLCTLEWRSSLLATFPGLLKLATPTSGDPMTLSAVEAVKMRGSDNKEKNSGYYKNLRHIVETSPKALWLFDFITGLETKKDVNGEEEKLIIVTRFPQVAFILKLFLQRYFPDLKAKIGLVTGGMLQKEKTEIINAFTGKNKAGRNIKILVGTARLLGVGLQLTRASNIVLMEPDADFNREMQGYSRVHRIGQKNPVSYSYRLINEASEIEQRILKRQADRKQIPGLRLSPQDLQKIKGENDDLEDDHLVGGRWGAM